MCFQVLRDFLQFKQMYQIMWINFFVNILKSSRSIHCGIWQLFFKQKMCSQVVLTEGQEDVNIIINALSLKQWTKLILLRTLTHVMQCFECLGHNNINRVARKELSYDQRSGAVQWNQQLSTLYMMMTSDSDVFAQCFLEYNGVVHQVLARTLYNY